MRRPLAVGGVALVATLLLAGCTSLVDRWLGPGPAPPDAPIRLRLIGERTLDHRLAFGGTVVGGLSGIDRDAAHDVYYVISDDRSNFSPTRFYTARLSFDASGFHDATLLAPVFLRRPDGSLFPASGSDDAADAEAIRVDPRAPRLWWTSEGERSVGGRRDETRLIDPFVRAADFAGRYLDRVPVDPMFASSADARGPRNDLAFEGLTFSNDGRSLWIAMEAPLIQDGPLPTRTHGAWSRFSRHDRPDADGRFGPLARQVAYPVDPIPPAFTPTLAFAFNGVSEILAYDDHRLLVLERALLLGSWWHVRLYLADLDGASDVRGLASLDAPPGTPASFVPMTKRLVLDFDALDVGIDNLEGLCFGPMLPNGHRTLIVVSDDNFNPGEKTQFLAFEIVPAP